MHMADALLSPTVGVTLWAISATVLSSCARRVQQGDQDHLVPLMGVLGAFVFAAQMINFTIPGTGSSGHIGGGLLLSILVGPHAAFVIIASVLTVQALFFADGGLLALGANIFNLGLFPCFVGYLMVYRPLVGAAPLQVSSRRIGWATLLAAVIGLQLGALGVVLETSFSGISNLPTGTFLLLMQPIHVAIGIVEGLATAVVILFVRRARPELFLVDACSISMQRPSFRRSTKPLLLALFTTAALTASVLSWFASSQPDGLEWSVAHASEGVTQRQPASTLHAMMADAQQRFAWLADYKRSVALLPAISATAESVDATIQKDGPAVDGRGSLAGLLGAVATLLLVLGIGCALRGRRSKP